uniref:Probable potassium transport system protein Kup n=1 Tax=Desulfobacca acetoxidans TaxID=60893 RepID=A0A7V4G8R8_9BACT
MSSSSTSEAEASPQSASPSPTSPSQPEPNAQAAPSKKLLLALGALGVVYGDIGTSPLYTVKECFHGPHAMIISTSNILGVMSLIFWSLTMVVTVKYVIFILRADNQGEGGIYALTALFLEKGAHKVSPRTLRSLVFLGIFGAALLYGDGLITPVISVLSALEGLTVATQAADPLVLPLSCGVLAGLFLVQKQGTARLGLVFGCIMLFWFTALAALGLSQILEQPHILFALDPRHAVSFFVSNRLHGVVVLGAVVLCITGGEALYADLGHFGSRAIRLSWTTFVFPALMLNYFGQGALLLIHPQAAGNPFYGLVPQVLLYPMVALATTATVIASQAMISGVYSLTQQAIQLGYCPRLHIVHTSGETRGQIYMPWVNTAMLVGCLGLALTFQESSRLASAYGIAVTGTMAITTVIFYYVSRYHWGWRAWQALLPAAVFLAFDLSFFGANLLKFFHGGWFTVAVAAVLTVIMITWRDGRTLLAQKFAEARIPLEVILKDIETYKLTRIPGTGAFLSINPSGTPLVLLHLLKHYEALPETVLLISILPAPTPFVSGRKRLTVAALGQGFYRLVAAYGFMEKPSIPEVLQLAADTGLEVDLYTTSFFLGRESLLAGPEPTMAHWRKALFIFLSRNAWNVSTYFGIPPGRVVELGTQVEI